VGVRRVGIVRIGGLSAVLSAAAMLAAVVLQTVAPSTRAGGFDAFLRSVALDTIYTVGLWFAVAALILSIPAVLAVAHILRYVGNIIWLPTLSYAIGVGLALVEVAVRLGVTYQLAGPFAAATGTEAATLGTVARTLLSMGLVLESIAAILAVTIGIGLLSGAILFLSDLPPRWVGWLGVLLALLAVIAAAPPFVPGLLKVLALGLVVWFAGLGAWLVRLRLPIESQ
jgi:hypothetical protein